MTILRKFSSKRTRITKNIGISKKNESSKKNITFLKTEILKRFTEKHKHLCALNPKIRIDEITESFSSESDETKFYDPPLLIIYVTHNFIFDNRLIPKAFENVEVVNETKSITVPKEFNPEIELPLWEVYSQKNYESFVENNFELIQKKLKSANMQKQEMLDALTGGFKTHIQYYEQLKRKFDE